MRAFALLLLISPVFSRQIFHYIDCVAGTSTTFGLPCEGLIETQSSVQFVADQQYGRVGVRCISNYVQTFRISCPRGNHTFIIRPTTYRTNVRVTQPQSGDLMMLILCFLIILVLYVCLWR